MSKMISHNKPATRSTSTSSLLVDNNSAKRSRDDLNKDTDEISSLNDLWTRMQMLVTESNSRIEAKIDRCTLELEKRIDSVQNQLLALRAECTNNISHLSEAVDVIRRDSALVSEKVSRLEKSQELLVSGVPFHEQENLKELYQTIATKLGYTNSNFPLVDIKRLARMPIRSGTSPPILIQFALRNEKVTFFRRYLDSRSLNLKDIGFDNTNRIFINENLTEHARIIRAEAVKLKKSGRIQQVYTRDGIVYTKSGGVAAEAIHTLEQFSSKFQ